MNSDGDSGSMTAGSLPRIEEVVLGLIPGIPKVHLHNKGLAYETGDEFMDAFHRASRDEIGPSILVVEGSIPNENINGDGYWTSMGNDPLTDRSLRSN